MTAFLSIRQIRKTFGAVVAVEDVSLEVPRGEFLTFLGPSGSGKSTTLYTIAGFQNPTSGEVLLEGKSLLSVPSHKRNIGMVFQRYTLFPHLSVAENIAFPLRVRRWSEEAIKGRVAEMLALVRLEGFDRRLPANLSGGQQQRVALARALAYDPPVLLMDEPLSALDKKLREEIQDEIRRIHRQTGVTILYVTHDQEEALRLSDRIALFNSGRIEQIATGQELYNNPATRFVAGFIGNSNFVAAQEHESRDEAATAVLPDGTAFANVPLHKERPGPGAGGCVLMVRPEDIRVSQVKPETGVEVTVQDHFFLGDCIAYTMMTAWGQEMSVRSPMAALPAGGISVGQKAYLSWETSSSCLFSARSGAQA